MAKPRFYFWALGLLVLLSCDDELSSVGFKNPNRDFDVVAKEFLIPTRVFQTDSVSTSNGFVDGSRSFLTDDPPRILVGSADHPVFGKTTAVGYSQYWAASFPLIQADAQFISLELIAVLDYYYWTGDRTGKSQLFQVHELTDSVLTYKDHFSTNSVPYGRLLGETTHEVDPSIFDENYIDNIDADATNDILDSLNIILPSDLGHELLAAAIDTVGTDEQDYNYFFNFRRKFKGFAFTSPNSDKIVGLNPHHAKTRMVLTYSELGDDGVVTISQLNFLFTPSQQAFGTPEYPSFTHLVNDRTGTTLAGLPDKYVDYEPTDGNRYVQAGTGVTTKLDFSEVYDYFKNVPTKALSAAELRIETDEQIGAPSTFKLRVLNSNNREKRSSKEYIDSANDPFIDVDATFANMHVLETVVLQKPYLKCDVLGDNSSLMTIDRVTLPGTGSLTYVGYLTNFMQQELSLSETDNLRYFELVPLEPDIAHSVSGFYFPAGNIKLTIYYTTPTVVN